MPNLRTHQLRVAGVAIQICDSLNINVSKETIITACLLHDMGNIIKFKLEYFPEFLEPEGLNYWSSVQHDYFNKYGKDEHEATLQIAKELGVSEITYELINSIGFTQAKENFQSSDMSKKIVSYADMRVSPQGVTSLQSRLGDLRKRYEGSNDEKSSNLKDRPITINMDSRQIFEDSFFGIEKQIFDQTKIKPEDITEQSITDRINLLKDFDI